MWIEVTATSLSVRPEDRKETQVVLDLDSVESFGRAIVGLGTIFTFKTGKSIETTASYTAVKKQFEEWNLPIVSFTGRPRD
jgi:hypothetical protein